eukprot:2288382-Rhodomonas_salina.1
MQTRTWVPVLNCQRQLQNANKHQLFCDFDEDTRAEAVQIVRAHRLSGCSLWDRQNVCLANFSGQMLDLW